MPSDSSIVVYEPSSPIRQPLRLLRGMWSDLLSSRELAWRLFVRDISARYRQTFLGYVWAFLPPVVTTLTFVFLNSSGVFKAGETSIPYPAFVLIGTLLWQSFVDAMQAPLRVVTAAKPMLAKINFPREALLLAAVGEAVFNFLIRLVLLVGVFVWFGIVPPPTAILLPVGVAALIALGSMIGILLTPIGLLFQDVANGVTLISGFWMLLTPVVYAPPETGVIRILVKWNPVSPLLVTTRDWIAVGPSQHMSAFVGVIALTFVLLLTGWVMYRLSMPHLVERMSA